MSPELREALETIGLSDALRDHPVWTQRWLDELDPDTWSHGTTTEAAKQLHNDVGIAWNACNTLKSTLLNLPTAALDDLSRYSSNISNEDSPIDWSSFFAGLNNITEALSVLELMSAIQAEPSRGRPTKQPHTQVAKAIALIFLAGNAKLPTHANYDAMTGEDRPDTLYISAVNAAFGDLGLSGNARHFGRKAIEFIKSGDMEHEMSSVSALLDHPILGLKKGPE